MFGKRSGDNLTYSKVETLIGEGTEFRGTVQTTGVIRVDGYLEGVIAHAGELVVGPKGKLLANIKAKAMAVAGEVRGEINVEGKLELLPTARMFGDVHCGHLVVQEGAVFKGRSHMGAPKNTEADETREAAETPAQREAGTQA